MQRLTGSSLLSFTNSADVTVVMFGATEGEATMAQACDFAEAWIEHRDEALFGYVDALEDVAAARAYAIRVLPTTLVMQRGHTVARLEGRCASTAIAAAIRDAAPAFAHAA